MRIGTGGGGRTAAGRRLGARLLLTLLSVAAPAAARAVEYTWTGGGGADTNWSNPANWGGTAPSNNEINATLTFPALTGPYATHNDLSGLHVTLATITTQAKPGTYTFTGNALIVLGPLRFENPGSGDPNLVWQIPLMFDANALIAADTGRLTQLQGNIDLGGHNVTFNTGGNIAVSGVISGSGNVTKNNTGALTLLGANTYGGTTTVNAGRLRLDGGIGSTAGVTVKSGATLQGNGSTAGPCTIERDGTLAPGTSPGALACGALAMTAGATLAVDIDGPAAVTDYDQLVVRGAVDLGGATLSVNVGGAAADGQTFHILVLQQGGGAGGTFAGLPDGATFTAGGTTFGIDYGESDIVLVASPDTVTPTMTPVTETPSPTPTIGASCRGDCDGNGSVSINELILGVNIALGNDSVDRCPAFDADGSGTVAIQELIAAVNNALGGCA
jgi:autotransporter-associated beta strand protein